ncbi:MAG: DNA alkylation repair protein [Bacteroidia bacterium]
MAEPLKNQLDKAFILDLADLLKRYERSFHKDAFVKVVLDKNWDNRELKDRTNHVAASMMEAITGTYTDKINTLRKVAPSFKGLKAFVFPATVEHFGIDYPEASFAALEEFTQYSTGEFAIRPFILRHREKAEQQILKWTKHSNEHVRRLASEGIRPLLPWASPLKCYKDDPSFVLKVVQKLLHDPSEYVRKSVANNLNDISKNHPDKVIAFTAKNIGKNALTDKLLHHACRTLLKSGNQETLELFGHSKHSNIQIQQLKVLPEKVRIGDTLHFQFTLKSAETNPQKLRIEYKIYFAKKNGTLSPKVFQLARGLYQKGTAAFNRTHRFTDFTTRKHYPGKHILAVIVNGVEKTRCSFTVYS